MYCLARLADTSKTCQPVTKAVFSQTPTELKLSEIAKKGSGLILALYQPCDLQFKAGKIWRDLNVPLGWSISNSWLC